MSPDSPTKNFRGFCYVKKVQETHLQRSVELFNLGGGIASLKHVFGLVLLKACLSHRLSPRLKHTFAVLLQKLCFNAGPGLKLYEYIWCICTHLLNASPGIQGVFHKRMLLGTLWKSPAQYDAWDFIN